MTLLNSNFIEKYFTLPTSKEDVYKICNGLQNKFTALIYHM